jgi:DNA topoisomerase-1
MILKNGRFGQFLACEKYPACKTTKAYNTTKDLGNCPKCSAALVEKRSKFGKFVACSNYPECKYIAGQETFACPVEGCGGTIKRKRTKSSKYFYGCSNYPKCTYVSWTKPA